MNEEGNSRKRRIYPLGLDFTRGKHFPLTNSRGYTRFDLHKSLGLRFTSNGAVSPLGWVEIGLEPEGFPHLVGVPVTNSAHGLFGFWIKGHFHHLKGGGSCSETRAGRQKQGWRL